MGPLKTAFNQSIMQPCELSANASGTLTGVWSSTLESPAGIQAGSHKKEQADLV